MGSTSVGDISNCECISSACLEKLQGVPPNVLLPFEPWGHIDHKGIECQCLSPDHTGASIHVQSIDQSPRDSVLSPLLSPLDMAAGRPYCAWRRSPMTRVPLHQQRFFRRDQVLFRLFLTELVHMGGCYWLYINACDTLSACDCLMPVTQGVW